MIKNIKGLCAVSIAAVALAVPSAAFAQGEVNIYSYRQEFLIRPLLDAILHPRPAGNNIGRRSKQASGDLLGAGLIAAIFCRRPIREYSSSPVSIERWEGSVHEVSATTVSNRAPRAAKASRWGLVSRS